jgi:hypothetical protein
MSAFDTAIIHGQQLALKAISREDLYSLAHATWPSPDTLRAYASIQSATIIVSTRRDLTAHEQCRILELYITWGLPTFVAVSAALDHPDPAFAHQFAENHGGVNWALRTLDPRHPAVRALIQYHGQMRPDIRVPVESSAY